MSRSDNDNANFAEPISVIEDLDPEPRANPGTWRIRELVVGLALLLGVSGWALGTWWHDDSNLTHYDQARQAAMDRRWEDALADYSSVRGYKDADARAAGVARQIQERDSQYEIASTHRQTGPAALVLHAARAVQTIQPGYKDIDDLAAQAADEVYTDALSGTVVMRTNVQPSGLYHRGSTGWQYLQNSDQWSSVLSIPLSSVSAKHLVYDVPGPGWTASAPTTSLPLSPYSPRLTEGSPGKAVRRLVMVTLPSGSEELKFENLQINPADFNFYISSGEGVWGLRYDPKTTVPVEAKGIFNPVSATYEKLGPQPVVRSGSPATDAVTSTVAHVAMPGADGMVADFGHGDSLLLAAHGQSVNNEAITQLYFAKADGSDARVVFSTTGSLLSALLSPNDRYALAVTSEPLMAPRGKVLVVATLLAVDGSGPPMMLQKVTVDDATGVSGRMPLTGQLTIGGVFLENGAFKNKLLLGWSDGTAAKSVTIWLLDVSNPSNILAETSVAYAGAGVLPVVEQPDGQTLLLYNQGVAATPAGGLLAADVTILRASSSTNNVTVSRYNVPLPQAATGGSASYLMGPALRGNNLIYRVETQFDMRQTYDYRLYSLSLTDLSGQESTYNRTTQPMQIFGGTWSASGSSSDSRPGLAVAGPGAYAFTDSDGTLHAHLYDSEVDVTLEKGMGTRFALNVNDYYKVLR